MSSPIKAYKDPKLPPPVTLPDGPEWIEVLRVFNAHVAETLFAATRTLYPHDSLPDLVYRRVVLGFDGLAAKMPALAQGFAELVDMLDAAMPVPFRELSEGYRIAALKSIEDSNPFRLVQRTTVRFLYDDRDVWQAFGYEGASVHLGGYVERGFNDLDWLPDPPNT